jgi:hypothetical protein
MNLLKQGLVASVVLFGSITTAQAFSISDTASDFCNLGAAPSSTCRDTSLDVSLDTPTEAIGDGILTLTLFGDFNTTLEFVTVDIEGTSFGSIFNNNQGDDPFDLDPDVGNEYLTAIIVSAAINNALLTSLINDGHFNISFTLSNGGTNTEDTVGNLFDGLNGEFITTQLDFNEVSTAPVPAPAAVWLFGSALLGLMGMKKRKKV